MYYIMFMLCYVMFKLCMLYIQYIEAAGKTTADCAPCVKLGLLVIDRLYIVMLLSGFIDCKLGPWNFPSN